MILGVILARANSKRLPNKNVLPLSGKPLVTWTIEAARAVPGIGRLIVSTDGDEIAQVASDAGAEVIRRPDELATDTATSYEALRHVLGEAGLVETVILLQPTSPLRTAADITAALALYARNQRPLASFAHDAHTPNGAIYIGSYEFLTDRGNWDTVGPLRYLMPAERSVDIDTAEDFARAEQIMQTRLKETTR
jgi:CMP-N,N'-diacetyllegionaminic acid synthase